MSSEKADRLSFETQARRPTDWCCCLCTRAMGKGANMLRRKTAAAVMDLLPQLFVWEGKQL